MPEPLWLEEDPQHLDHPFFIMEEITGCEATPFRLMAPPYDAHLKEIGRQKWTILGEIAKADPQALGLVGVMEPVAPGEAWRRELDRWLRDLDADEIEPQPITRAAIRWLRANPPPPAQRMSVVHADYRTGNFLVDETGKIRGILDWELAHLGDPLEDLAWGINRVWCWNRDDRGRWAPAQGRGHPPVGGVERAPRRPRRPPLVGDVLVREGPGDLALRRARVPRRPEPGTRSWRSLPGCSATARTAPSWS